MIPLPETFTKDGIPGRIVERCGRVVLIRRDSGSGGCWEVAFVKEVPTTVVFGREVLAHEKLPSNEEWGTHGWTKKTEAEARELFDRKAGESIFGI